MPMGRGRGRRFAGPGWGGGLGMGPGPGGGRGRGALLEPAVLAALAQQSAHGYDLRRSVEEMTEGIVIVDPGGIYRLLRRLEQEGFVESAWAEGEFGPQRRQYRLTADGRDLLAHWRDDLERRRLAFGSVIAAIDRLLGVEPPKREEAASAGGPNEKENPNEKEGNDA
jgi:PadR family transcriptional regulator PadR